MTQLPSRNVSIRTRHELLYLRVIRDLFALLYGMVGLLERGLPVCRPQPAIHAGGRLTARCALIIDILTSFSEVANSSIWSVRPRITLLLVGFSVGNAKVRQSDHLTTTYIMIHVLTINSARTQVKVTFVRTLFYSMFFYLHVIIKVV